MKTKIGANIIYVLFLVLVVELTSRFYWSSQKKIPFFEMQKILYVYYPELKAVEEAANNSSEGHFDILILNGSALNPRWGQVLEFLAKEMGRQRVVNKNVRILNLAISSHTSLDSFYKYNHLKKKHFDLVMLYHGINEVRANNCPPEVFKEDYSHYSWYLRTNALRQHKEVRWLVFPFTLHNLGIDLLHNLGFYKNILHRENVREDWADFGGDIKTAGPFRQNMKAILDLAAEKKERLLLMSFASCLPADYTREKFDAGTMGYIGHKCPAELWGRPEHVAAGIAAHNQVVYDLAQEYQDQILFIDQARLIPQESRFFSDICHFSPEGSRKFVAGIMAEKETVFAVGAAPEPVSGGGL